MVFGVTGYFCPVCEDWVCYNPDTETWTLCSCITSPATAQLSDLNAGWNRFVSSVVVSSV